MANVKIPPKVQDQMKRLGLQEPEVVGAFNSPVRYSGKAKGTTCGVADYGNRVVGAIYFKDSKTGEWVIVSVWVREKKRGSFL